MTSPEDVERQHTLRTAVARYEELRAREVLADSADGSFPDVAEAERLPAAEVLELLALSEVIARKAGYGQQLAVRTARAAGPAAQLGDLLRVQALVPRLSRPLGLCVDPP